MFNFFFSIIYWIASIIHCDCVFFLNICVLFDFLFQIMYKNSIIKYTFNLFLLTRVNKKHNLKYASAEIQPI